MTNTLHRQGTAQDLKNDYVIFATTSKEINREGSARKFQEFIRICLKYHPVNIGDSKQGNILQDDIDIQELISNQKDGAGADAVFTDLDTLQKVMEELIEADLGLSINISGLLDGVQECCRKNGIERHSVEHSLGFWGSTDRLPEREILEVNTLCGHGMGKCCECGVFKTGRAETLLERIRKGS
jgi:hypothetical protein